MSVAVDTSAWMAVLLNESAADVIIEEMAHQPELVVSAATYVEASIVVEARLGPAGPQLLDRLIREAGMQIVDLTVRSAANRHPCPPRALIPTCREPLNWTVAVLASRKNCVSERSERRGAIWSQREPLSWTAAVLASAKTV